MSNNTSKTYLLPLLSELISFEMKFMKYITNTFLFLEDDDQKYLCILHDFSFRVPDFTRYEHVLTDSPLFVKNIDLDNQVLYVFKFPEEYLHEFDMFCQGKYSKFGTDAKELILNFWAQVYKGNAQLPTLLSNINQVLSKSPILKKKLEDSLAVVLDDDQELGEIMNPERETFVMKQVPQSKKP